MPFHVAATLAFLSFFIALSRATVSVNCAAPWVSVASKFVVRLPQSEGVGFCSSLLHKYTTTTATVVTYPVTVTATEVSEVVFTAPTPTTTTTTDTTDTLDVTASSTTTTVVINTSTVTQVSVSTSTVVVTTVVGVPGAKKRALDRAAYFEQRRDLGGWHENEKRTTPKFAKLLGIAETLVSGFCSCVATGPTSTSTATVVQSSTQSTTLTETSTVSTTTPSPAVIVETVTVTSTTVVSTDVSTATTLTTTTTVVPTSSTTTTSTTTTSTQICPANAPTQLVANSGFEAGLASWTTTRTGFEVLFGLSYCGLRLPNSDCDLTGNNCRCGYANADAPGGTGTYSQVLAGACIGKKYTFTAFVGLSVLVNPTNSFTTLSVYLDDVEIVPNFRPCTTTACTIPGGSGSFQQIAPVTVIPRSLNPVLQFRFISKVNPGEQALDLFIDQVTLTKQ